MIGYTCVGTNDLEKAVHFYGELLSVLNAKIFVLRPHLLEGVGADMVVGDHQAVTRYKGGGAAAVEADGGKADVVEPGIGEIEAVFGFDLGAGRGRVEPHAFVGAKGAAGKERGEG